MNNESIQLIIKISVADLIKNFDLPKELATEENLQIIKQDIAVSLVTDYIDDVIEDCVDQFVKRARNNQQNTEND